ncbi:chorismate mutase [Andreprevotia chitinilytica]|uniref:chorismate mutase n=1 Tax=Andreprevotia chitinilytica TaxID=396808 RepID=UPI00054D980A|nr:chorismate mutase [Andreprevotia chitinilytica]
MTQSATDQLTQLRERIDALDAELVALLARRFALTREVGQLKKTHQLPPSDPAREAAQTQRITALAELNAVPPQVAERVLRVIVDEVVAEHRQIANVAI